MAELIRSEAWDELYLRLSSLDYVEERAGAGLIFSLVREYDSAAGAIPRDHEGAAVLSVLAHGLREHAGFIAKHPSAVFQCLWNACWWHDCSDRHGFSEPGRAAGSDERRQENAGPVSRLLERWRSEKEARSPRPFWIRSLRPPSLPVNDELRLKIGVDVEPYARMVLRLQDDRIVVWFCAYVDRKITRLRTRAWNVFDGAEIIDSELAGVPFPEPLQSPDGLLIASTGRGEGGGWGAPVEVTNARTGEVIVSFPVNENHNLRTAAFSSDGRRLAAFGYCDESGGEVYAWDLDTKSLLVHLQPRHWPTTLAFSPDGRQILTGSSRGELELWTIDGANRLRILAGHEDHVLAVAFSPDGILAASGSADGSLRVWDLTSPPRTQSIPFHPDSVMEAHFSPDGKRLITRSGNGTTWLWEGGTGKPIACLHQSNNIVLMGGDARASLLVDERRIVSLASKGGTWACSDGHRLAGPLSLRAWLGHKVVSCPDIGLVAIWNEHPGDGPRQLGLHEIETGQYWLVPCHESGICCAAFSSNGRYLVIGSANGTVQVWDVRREIQSVHQTTHREGVVSCDVSAEGDIFVATGCDGSVSVMDSTTGIRIADLDFTGIPALEYGENQEDVFLREVRLLDGQTLAGLTNGSRLVVWNYRTRDILRMLRWTGSLKDFSMDAPFSAFVRGSEVIVSDAQSGVEMGWFPCPNGFPGYTGLISYAGGSCWAGCLRNHIFHFMAEGGESS